MWAGTTFNLKSLFDQSPHISHLDVFSFSIFYLQKWPVCIAALRILCFSCVLLQECESESIYMECVCLTLLFAAYSMYTHTDNKQLLTAQQRHTKSLLEVTYAASMLMSSSVKESCTSVCVCWYWVCECVCPSASWQTDSNRGQKAAQWPC